MSVEDVIQLEVFIVLAQGVVQRLRHSQPAEVKEEFDCHEDRIVDVHLALCNRLLPVHLDVVNNGLLRNERDGKVDVDGQGDDLSVDEGDSDLTVGRHLDQAGPELCQPGDEGGVGRAGGDEPALPSRDQDLGAPLEGQPPVGVQDVVALLLSYERSLVLVNQAGGHDGLDGGEPLPQSR